MTALTVTKLIGSTVHSGHMSDTESNDPVVVSENGVAV